MSLECATCPICGNFVLLEDTPKGTRIGSYWSDSTLICNKCKKTPVKTDPDNTVEGPRGEFIYPSQTSRGKKSFNQS